MTTRPAFASLAPSANGITRKIAVLLATPAIAIFLATNIANAGNLAFNMVFSRVLSLSEYHDLAVLLTLKLAVLSIFCALQMAISKHVAEDAKTHWSSLPLARLSIYVVLAISLLIPFVAAGGGLRLIADAFGIEQSLVFILLLSVPGAIILSFARGVAHGQLSVSAIVWSVQLEMIVRFAGAVVAWALGFGLMGIVLAMSLSLIIGWIPLRKELPLNAQVVRTPSGVSPLARKLAWLALPFAALQLAQVAHLDGELLLSNALLPKGEADLVAGLSLIQRIQFYSCFCLAAVLLPTVSNAARTGQGLVGSVVPVVGLVGATGGSLLICACFAPELLIGTIAGQGFLGAAPALLPAVIAALAYTSTYLVATLLVALDDFAGVWIVALAAPVSMAIAAFGAQTGGLVGMLEAKSLAQVGLLVLVGARAHFRLKRGPADSRVTARP